VLTLNRRPCRIGTSINTRREKHGDENVTAIDVPLSGLMLEAAELNMILREPHAHGVFFDHAKGGALVEPVFRDVVPFIPIAGKAEGAEVQLEWNNTTVMLLLDCKLARMRLVPQVGGLTALALQVQCTPKLDSLVAKLLERLDSDVDVTIRCDGYGAQQELPLGKGNGEDDDEGDES
jgi:hypothetical protein